MTASIAVLPIRSGLLPPGSAEVVAEAPDGCWLVGDGCEAAAGELAGSTAAVVVIERRAFEPRAWARLLAGALPPDRHLLLPNSADGRDLAPHLAAVLGRHLIAGATELEPERAVVARRGGLTMETLALDGPVVATFQLGVRDGGLVDGEDAPTIEHRRADEGSTNGVALDRVELLETVEADPETMDLAEAPRIVAGGAGLGESAHFDRLHEVSAHLGASVGATRVVTDWGWISADRQIGTTGVAVDPELYLAVGISGAIQHTAGLGSPDHTIVVNTDPSCPMMDLADLAIRCDGPTFLDEFVLALEALSRTSATPSSNPGQDLEA